MDKGSENSYAGKPRLRRGTGAEYSQGRKGNGRLLSSHPLIKTIQVDGQKQSTTSFIHTARSL